MTIWTVIDYHNKQKTHANETLVVENPLRLASWSIDLNFCRRRWRPNLIPDDEGPGLSFSISNSILTIDSFALVDSESGYEEAEEEDRPESIIILSSKLWRNLSTLCNRCGRPFCLASFMRAEIWSVISSRAWYSCCFCLNYGLGLN